MIDKDRVDVHNLGTQVYGEKDVGAVKVDALKNRIFRDLSVEIDTINKELTASNAKTLLKGSDLVVDCFDNSESRKMIQDECRARKINLCHLGLFASYGETIWDAHYEVRKNAEGGDVCDYPLARNIILLTVIVGTEEILDFFLSDKPRQKNWSITLGDLAVKEIK